MGHSGTRAAIGDWVRQRRVWVSAAVSVATSVVVAVIALTAGAAPDSPRPSASPSEFTVLHPDDGTLLVGEAEVRQLAGRCTDQGTSCEFVRVQQLPRIVVPAGVPSVKLTAGQSDAFSVSVYSTSGAEDYVLSTSAGRLHLGELPAGDYRVALTGDAGGVWQFDLTREGPRARD